MTEPVIPEPGEVIESITPSPLVKYLLIGALGVAGGIALGYLVAKILEEDRAGHYVPDAAQFEVEQTEEHQDEAETVTDETALDLPEPPNVNVE